MGVLGVRVCVVSRRPNVDSTYVCMMSVCVMSVRGCELSVYVSGMHVVDPTSTAPMYV